MGAVVLALEVALAVVGASRGCGVPTVCVCVFWSFGCVLSHGLCVILFTKKINIYLLMPYAAV